MADDMNKFEEEMGEEESDIIELTDEDGVVSKFEYLTTIDHEGELYVVLMAADEAQENDEEGEVVILKIEKDGDEDIYVSVDDEKIQDAVFEKFMQMVNEEADE